MKNVVIIGAGPAGLVTAYELLNKSGPSEYRVIVLEKDNEIGGLSKTITFGGGRVDIGGHRFFSKNEEILNLWRNLLPKNDKGMLQRERLSHILWNSKLINYPIQLDIDTVKALGIFDSVKVILSYLKEKCGYRKINNLEDFYVNRFGKQLYSMFFKDYTEKLWGVSASNLSSDWGEQRVQKISIRTLVLSALGKQHENERSLIKKYNYPALGAGQLWEELAKKVVELGGIIETGSTVEHLQLDDSQIKVVKYRNGNDYYQLFCDYVISSMPLRDLIFSINESPYEIKEICKRLYFRDMIVVAFDLEQDSMGANYHKVKKDSWIYMQDTTVTFGRIQILNNWSPYAVKVDGHVLLEIEYFCKEGDSLWNKVDMDIVEWTLKELTQCGICNEKPKIFYSIVKRVEKAYPIYTDGYNELSLVKEWVNTINNLQCIGRNGQHRYNNMDHAVETGLIAARNIINQVHEKESIWNVNVDKKFLEK